VQAMPNILIVKPDQHNARCMGINGHPQVKTPNIDALAADGVHFPRAFVQSAICSPSRMSYLSGQYVHNHGVYGLSGNETLPPVLPSLFSTFKAAGYRTGVIGHVHVKDDWLEPHCDMYRPFQDDETDAYNKYLEAKGKQREDIEWKGLSQILDACPGKLSFEDSAEGYALTCFDEFLDARPDSAPFLFQIDAMHPHQCYIPAKQFWDLYEGVDLELPPNLHDDITNKPPNQQKMHAWARAGGYTVFEPKTLEAARLRKLRGYYGCVSQVDHMLGLARRMLKDQGLEENTIVIYCTDHGDMAMEHDLPEKAPGISYDAILRTPFIWAWPAGGFQQGTVDELVESVDQFPTLCTLAGVRPPDTVDGIDISPMLRGDHTPVRDCVFAEFPWSRTIRTDEWLLCHRPVGMYREGMDDGELYNVKDDPWQINNLYHDQRCRDIREQLRRRLFDWILQSTRYCNTWPHLPQGADGKIDPDELRRQLAVGGPWDIAYT